MSGNGNGDSTHGNRKDPRNRLQSGLSKTRIGLQAKRALAPTTVFIVGVAVALLIVSFLLLHISKTFGRSTYEVKFASPTAFGVFEGFDDVRFRGVPAGNIAKIERQPGGGVVLVAKIQKKYGPVYKNAQAQLRPITALNDVYLDIVDPGTPSAGKATASDILPKSAVQTSVNVQDVLDAITPDARQGFYELLDNLGNGSADGGDSLRRGFVQLAPFIEQAGVLSHEVAVRKQTTKELIHNASLLTDELGKRQGQLRNLVSAGAATLGTLQEGSKDLDATLRQIGPFFTNIDSTLTSLNGIVDNLDSGLRSLQPVSDALPGALQAIREGSQTFDTGLSALQRPFRVFPAWLRAINSVVVQAVPLASSLDTQIPPYQRTVQDLKDCQVGFTGFWQWNASFTKYGDSTAPIPRGNLGLGIPALTNEPTAVRQPPTSCVVHGASSDTVGGRPINAGDYH